jgi:Flp pilus assembly protein TadG
LIRAHRDERGLVTVETLLALVMVTPLLFGVIQFGWLFQRWLAAETVAAHAARYAGELGGDDPALRAYVARELSAVSIDPARVTVEVDPPRVSWREAVRVSIRSQESVALPFLFAAPLTISATAVARGELAR